MSFLSATLSIEEMQKCLFSRHVFARKFDQIYAGTYDENSFGGKFRDTRITRSYINYFYFHPEGEAQLEQSRHISTAQPISRTRKTNITMKLAATD